MAPHVLMVPGSFCPPDLYNDVLAGLTSRGLSASAMALVTVGPKSAPEQRAQPPRSMYDDAAAIAAEVERLAAVHADGVVVVAHSYAGIPVSQSLKVLNDESRHTNGSGAARPRNGGLKAIVYLASVVPDVGVPLAGPDASAKEGERDVDTETAPNTNSIKILDDGYMAQDGELCVDLILNDMADRARGVEMIDNSIGVHSGRSFTDPLTYPGYNDVASAWTATAANAGGLAPLTWIKPRADACVVPAYQDAMIAGVRKSLVGAGIDAERALRVVDFESGHCPNVTQPEKLAEAIAKIVRA